MPLIQLEQVNKFYAGADGVRRDALLNINLSVQRGEFLVLAGPSGSGKTTLLRLVAGLEKADAGAVSIGGVSVEAIPARSRPVAMVFQSPALFPDMTVWENIAFGLVVRGLPRQETNQRVTEAIEVLGLGHCQKSKPGLLSGGERQRVSLGRALVRRPEVLLLDEPFSSLDPQLRAQLRAVIRQLHARIGGATMYVTHDQSEALLLGDSLAVLRGAGLEQIGAPENVYDYPATTFVAEFVGPRPMNLIPGELRVSGNQLHFKEASAAFEFLVPPPACGDLASPRPVLLGIRPEHLLVGNPPGIQSEGWPTIPGCVEAFESTGPEAFLTVRCGQTACQARCLGSSHPVAGSLIPLHLDPARLRWFNPQTGRSFPRV